MKKYISSLFVVMSFFLVCGMFGVASASTAPKIFVDGSQLHSDVDPVITQGTTLVPLAVLSTGLGYDVKWDNSIKQVTVKDKSTTIVLTIGNTIGSVNNESYEMLQAPSIIKGRTMVPLRFVTEILGFTLEWKQAEKEIYLTSPVKIPEPTPTVTPSVQTATITSVVIDQDSTLHISYSGVMKEPSTMVLTSPSRLVIDLPDTGYTEDLSNKFIKGQTEVSLNGYEGLTGYRYSIFSNNPLKARIVVLLTDNSSYQVTKTDSEVLVTFGHSNTSEPAEPTPTPSATPTPSETPSTGNDSSSSQKVYNIVLDAGHGGRDPGSGNSRLGLLEKDFTLMAVLKLKDELEKISNVKVYLTRSGDTYPDLNERVAFAENIPGLGKKADIFISIHANSAKNNPTVTGTETYYNRANSKALAETLHPYMLNAVGLKDRGVKTAGFRVIKATTMPAILLEAGFISNDKDAKTIFDENVQKKLAQELTKGIKKYLNL